MAPIKRQGRLLRSDAWLYTYVGRRAGKQAGKTGRQAGKTGRRILICTHACRLYIGAYNGQGYFYQGGQGGIAPPLNFDNPKRSKMLYVTCSTIIRSVVVAARCKSSVIDFWIFLKYFLDVL